MTPTFWLDGIDITSDVETCDIALGFDDPWQHMASIGTCMLVVKNPDRVYSPSNTNSPIYTSLLPNKVVTVTEVPADPSASSVTLFRGYVQSIRPDADQYGNLRCTIDCEDTLGLLQNHLISLPLQEDKTPSHLLRLITSSVFRGALATGTIGFSDLVADDDTVTIGDVTYTFKTVPAMAYEVKKGSSGAEAAAALTAAIHVAGEEFAEAGTYGDGTLRNPYVSAEYVPAEGEGGGTVTLDVWPGGVALLGPAGNVSGWAYRHAQKFTPVTGVLDSFSIEVTATEFDLTDTTWEIREDNANRPTGALLATGTFAPPVASGTKTVSGIGGPILYAESSYWLVLRKASAAEYFDYLSWDIKFDDTGVDDPNNAYKIGSSAWAMDGTGRATLSVTTAGVSGATMTLTALARGAWGNDIALAKAGANITVSGATLEGGADEPAGLIDFDTGRQVLEIAADMWRDDDTNALTAIQDVAESEWGYFWCARDGTLTFRDSLYTFELANKDADLPLDDDHNFQDTALSALDIANRVTVSYRPRGTLVAGVLARANSVISVDGRMGAGLGSSNFERWNPAQDKLQSSGSKTITLPFIEVGGRPIGGRSLTLPLEPGVDFTIFDFEDGSGWDYTYDGLVKFSQAIVGSGVEVHLTNTALGTLYIFGLQQRGTGVIDYEPINFTMDDPDSQEDYGRRPKDLTLPLQLAGGGALAEQIARLVLARYARPMARVNQVGFTGIEAVGGTSVYDIDIGDVVEVSETQTALSETRHWVIGINYNLVGQDIASIMFTLAPLGEFTYLTLDDPVLGLLNQNRLAL